MNEYFKMQYGRSIAEGDEFILSLWGRVLPQLQVSLRTIGMDNIPKVSASELKLIENILQVNIPKLRRDAAPSEKSFAHQIANFFRTDRKV